MDKLGNLKDCKMHPPESLNVFLVSYLLPFFLKNFERRFDNLDALEIKFDSLFNNA